MSQKVSQYTFRLTFLVFSAMQLRQSALADFVKIARGLIPVRANSEAQSPSKPSQPPPQPEAGVFIPKKKSASICVCQRPKNLRALSALRG